MADIPVISNHVLHGMPAFVRHEMGRKALLQANRAAGFDLERVEGRNCFIPHAAVIGFVTATARAAGEDNLGVLMVPEMNAANYGSYGRYLLGADTLGQAIERAITALPYHSTDDRMSVSIVGDEVRYSYTFALAGCDGYPSSQRRPRAFSSVSARTTCRVTGGRSASNSTSTSRAGPGCSKTPLNAPSFSRSGDDHRHRTPSSRGESEAPVGPIVTIEDVARDRHGGAPRNLLDVIVEHIRTQVRSGRVSIDSAAQSMDTSIRTLQRAKSGRLRFPEPGEPDKFSGPANYSATRMARSSRFRRRWDILRQPISRGRSERRPADPAGFRSRG